MLCPKTLKQHINKMQHQNNALCERYHQCMYMSTLVLAHVLLGVTVRYEEDQYSVDEEAGYVTLALVLDGEASVPVTVIVNTLDLLNSSIGNAATGELLEFASG